VLDILKDKSKLDEIRTSEKYTLIRKNLIDIYEEICNKDLHISFDVETEFFRNGNRTAFQEKYFLRRTFLTVCAILAIIYPEETKYITDTEEIIFRICNEYSWQLPAHRPRDNWNRRDDIDLFAAETGLYLAEIKYILADRLSPLLINRITMELEWRILKSFESYTFWWEELKSNWASVCSGSVGGVFLYESLERYEKISCRISACMKNYLSGINDEGSTSEGAGYWSYGFSFYTLYHDLLRRYTNGENDGFKNKKVENLAGFLTNLYFDEDNLVLFSDAVQGTRYPVWLLMFLKKEYGIAMPPKSKGDIVLEKFSSAIRSILYYDESSDDEFKVLGNVYYKELQWYIEKNPLYSIAVKGGNNEEEHNHNDIGSFMIVHNKHVILSELGMGEYTADYCGDNRYTCLEPSAQGHSIPVINNTFQQYGSEYYGVMDVKDNVVIIDMKNAYPIEIESFIRKFQMFEEKFILTDTFDSSLDVKERFITEIEPIVDEENNIKIAGAKLCVSSEWEISVASEIRNRHDGRTKRKIFILDFTTKEITDKFEMKIIFE